MGDIKEYNYNYTYLLEYSDGRSYHGCRSCDCPIKDDNYYGSSKHTPDEIPKKTILTEHLTRKDAVDEEIRYQAEYDVKNNDLYYNRSNQTSTGFDTTGTTHTPEAKQKLSDANKGKNNPRFGTKHTPETRQKMSDANAKDWIITYPNGKEELITNLNKFCRENPYGLQVSHFAKVAQGKQKHHKGYKARYASQYN